MLNWIILKSFHPLDDPPYSFLSVPFPSSVLNNQFPFHYPPTTSFYIIIIISISPVKEGRSLVVELISSSSTSLRISYHLIPSYLGILSISVSSSSNPALLSSPSYYMPSGAWNSQTVPLPLEVSATFCRRHTTPPLTDRLCTYYPGRMDWLTDGQA